MKVTILHLSDFHLKAKCVLLSRVDALCRTLRSLTHDVAGVITVVSGDIAFSGSAGQYEIAARFFADICNALERQLAPRPVKFVLLPGNTLRCMPADRPKPRMLSARWSGSARF